MLSWFLYKTKTTKFWIFVLLATFLYVGLLLRLELYYKNYAESFPLIHEISAQTKRLASQVDTGIHIKTFPQFSVTQGLFIMDATVWFRFDKSVESLDTLSRFTVQNSEYLDSRSTMLQSKPMVSLLEDKVLVAYNIQVKFRNSFEYKKFPLENHRLHIVLVNESVTPQELCLNTHSSYVEVSNDTMINDWKPMGTNAHAGYLQAILDKKDPVLSITYPCVAFSIDIERVGYRSLTSLYFPLFVLFLIGLLSMMIGIFDLTRLGIISASLPMLVLYRLVIDANSPVVAYATHIDFVYYSLVFLSLPILILQMYVALEGQKIQKSPDDVFKHQARMFLELVNSGVFLAILLLFALLMTYNFLR